jgi:hypothetical protein
LDLDPNNVVTQSQFSEWWSSDNVNPLFKIGLLLGVPLLAIGLASMLFKGFSTGSVLMSLLGLAGLGVGIHSYTQFSQQQQNAPRATITSTKLQDILNQFGIQQPIQQVRPIQQSAETSKPASVGTPQANPTNLLGLVDMAKTAQQKGLNPEQAQVMAKTLRQFVAVIDEILKRRTTGTWWGALGNFFLGTPSGIVSGASSALGELRKQLSAAANALETDPSSYQHVASQLIEQYNTLTKSLQSLAAMIGADVNNLTAGILQTPPEIMLKYIRSKPDDTAEDALRAIADLGKQYRS